MYDDNRERQLFIISSEQTKPILGRKFCIDLGLVKLVLEIDEHQDERLSNCGNDLFEG